MARDYRTIGKADGAAQDGSQTFKSNRRLGFTRAGAGKHYHLDSWLARLTSTGDIREEGEMRKTWTLDELLNILKAIAMQGGDAHTLAAIAQALGLSWRA